MRAQLNRVVLIVALLVVLPAIAIAERGRRGAGRRVGVGAIRAVARVIGVRFDVSASPASEGSGPFVLVPNHRSPLDIPAILLARPGVRFLAAAELFRIPLLASAMRALGCVPIDRRDPAQAHAEIDKLAADGSTDLVVFAEGGIRRGPVGRLKSGAFRVAIASGRAVVPVAIRGTGQLLGTGRRLRVRPGTVMVEMGDPIPTNGLRLEDRDALRDRTRAALESALGDEEDPTGARRPALDHPPEGQEMVMPPSTRRMVPVV